MAIGATATVLWMLDRDDEAVLTLDGLIGQCEASPDSFFVRKKAESLEQKGRILSGSRRSDEAVAAFDKGIETLEGLGSEDRAPLLIEILLHKAEALIYAQRADEALVLLNSAIDVYLEWSAQFADAAAKAKATLALAVLRKIGTMDTVSRVVLSSVTEPVLRALGDAPLQPQQPQEDTAPPSSELAALVAETHAGDCWFQFATATDDHVTRGQMAARAVELYVRTLPWLLEAIEPDSSKQEEEEEEEDEDEDDEYIHRFASTILLRSVADGYALLSTNTINRSNLPLPTRGLIEWGSRVTGVAAWAEENGYPLVFQEPSESVEALLDEERTKALEQLNTDAAEDLERKFVTAFTVAAWGYHVLAHLTSFEDGQRALHDYRLKAFAVTQISQSRWWATWAHHRMQDAAGAALVMLLMAQTIFVACHMADQPKTTAFQPSGACRAA